MFKLSERDVRMLNSLNAELKSGKTVILRPIATCRRLEKLAGRTDAELRVWDLMRPEFKLAYPLEAMPLRLTLNKIRQRLKEEK